MNYIGSKKSLISFIHSSIKSVTNDKFDIICDLFAGTGVVASSYATTKSVIANDVQYYSFILLKSFLETSKIDKKILDELNDLKGKRGFVTKSFSPVGGRMFFTEENAKKCDAIRERLEEFHAKNMKSFHYYLASLIEAMDKVANTASVYGAFLKKFKKTALHPITMQHRDLIKTKKTHKVYNENADILIKKIEGDVLYLDPPYNQRQYSANYHILEMIAKNDKPNIKGITALPDNYFKSNYCYKNKAKNALESLIANAKFKYIFLSYNNEGIIPMDDIKLVMKGYGDYERFETEYKTFKQDSNRNNKSSKTIEYLHCLIKNT